MKLIILVLLLTWVALTQAADVAELAAQNVQRSMEHTGVLHFEVQGANSVFVPLPDSAGKVEVTQLKFAAGHAGQVQLRNTGVVDRDCTAATGHGHSGHSGYFKVRPGLLASCIMPIPDKYNNFVIACYHDEVVEEVEVLSE